jgi:DNA-binding LytR/AlgR family response regulator
MKLRCIIVEDEPLARSFLEKFCNRSGMLTVAGLFPNAEEALAFLKNNEVDIIFLDVEMPGINGFQLLDQLVYMPRIVLTSSKTEYAYTAFEYNVTAYLKKPIQYNRFIDSINKIRESLNNNTAEHNPEDIFIKSDGKFVRLSYEDILFIESVGDYVKYVTTAKKYITHSTLRAIEEKMDKRFFLKVHRSYIVNIRKIKDIQDHTLVIEGSVIPISKTHKAEVMERLRIG